MSNSFFNPGEQRTARVNDLFGAIASRYDLLNDLQSFGLHRTWKRKLVEMAGVRPGERALDVCCGTGDIARALAKRGAQVIGLDFSGPMLEIAVEKSKRQNPIPINHERGFKARTLEFIHGDAQQLPFGDNSFEIVTVGYGLRNLKSWEAGLREMQRVAKPGGRLLALDFGKPDNAIWRAAYFFYLKWFVPVLGRIFCGNAPAYAYILESLKQYPAQHGLTAKMRELGLKNVELVNLLGGIMSIHRAEK